MSGWMYMKKGILNDSQQGPLADAELLQLAYDGVVTPQTLAMHPTLTHGQWVEMARLPAGVKRHEEGIRARQEEQDKRKQETEDLKAAKSEEKRLKAEAAASVPVFKTQPQSVAPANPPTDPIPTAASQAIHAATNVAMQLPSAIYNVVRIMCWLATIGGSLIGALITVVTLSGAKSAIQEASGAALGVACAVIPYCIARAVTELGRR